MYIITNTWFVAVYDLFKLNSKAMLLIFLTF